MDVSIPNMIENNHQQSINPVQEINSQTKKISLDELAKATETLKKYIYQQTKKEVQTFENKPVVNEIQLAEQPTINSDVLSEETPLVYENVSAPIINSESVSEIPSSQEVTTDNIIDATSLQPVTTVVQSETPVIQPQLGIEEVSNEFTNVEPYPKKESQIVDVPPIAESITVDNFLISENVSITTLDGISQSVISESADNNSYVATSNIATVNSDYNTNPPEVIPVTMPDGQQVQENMGGETLITSPQSFGMM